jgi:uncharacterized membrane protein (UPF0182 family)
VPFHSEDPFFHKDIGFYVFDLPWLHYLVDFTMAVAVVSLLAAAVVHYLYGGIRLQTQHDRLSGAAQAQISVLLGVFVLAKGADYYLDRFDLVTGSGGLITGMTYTDDHAVLPSKNILMVIAVICAVLFFLNVWRRTWMLPSVGLALLALSAVLLGLIWPGIVQQFQVKPSEADKEAPYIKRNIEATRSAYDVEDVKVDNYSSNADLANASLGSLDGQTSSAPLVDPQLVRQAFEQNQQVRAFYTVASVLDVDRYDIEGNDRALVLGVRELDQSGINDADKNWSNLHTVYTHGNGIIAAYANQRPKDDSAQLDPDAQTQSAGIEWAEGNGAGQDDLTEVTGGFEDRVYYGELSPDYSIVGTASTDAKDVELNLPTNGSDEGTTTTYEGDGGVPVGGFFNKVMYAVKFGDSNFLLSKRVNSNSQLLYNRNPRERVEKVAPWLTIDSDAYPAVVNGRILWIVDGYTTTNRYPQAESDSFEKMIDDSLQTNTDLRTLPTDDINYMRNAVKATVDAYDGTVTLYAWDEEDPILQAWRSAFPDTVKDKSEISPELMQHLRYPEDLFKVQRYQLAKYHVTDARAFQQGSDWWQVPLDPNSPVDHLMAPYRMFLDAPGSDKEVWSLSTTFSPTKRNNLSAVMTVNSDATSEDYGKIQVLERLDQQTQGPRQVASDLKNDSAISEALLPYRGTGSLLNYGNLLTIPTTSHGLIYLMPIYARQGTSSPYPKLAYVLVSYDKHLGYGRTLQEAITSALRSNSTPTPTQTPTPTPTPSPTPSGSPSPSTGNAEARARQLLDDAQSLFTQAEAAGKEGNFSKREELLKQAQQKVAEAVALLNG